MNFVGQEEMHWFSDRKSVLQAVQFEGEISQVRQSPEQGIATFEMFT